MALGPPLAELCWFIGPNVPRLQRNPHHAGGGARSAYAAAPCFRAGEKTRTQFRPAPLAA